MDQKDTFAALDRLRTLALMKVRGDEPEYEGFLQSEITEGFQTLFAQLPENLGFYKNHLTIISTEMTEHRPESIVECLYPILAPLLERGESGTLPEVQWSYFRREKGVHLQVHQGGRQ